jgi:hypothetical protein
MWAFVVFAFTTQSCASVAGDELASLLGLGAGFTTNKKSPTLASGALSFLKADSL